MEGRIKSLISSNLQMVKMSLWGEDAPGAKGVFHVKKMNQVMVVGGLIDTESWVCSS